MLERLRNRAIHRVRHPEIIGVYDEEPGARRIAQPFLQGRTCSPGVRSGYECGHDDEGKHESPDNAKQRHHSGRCSQIVATSFSGAAEKKVDRDPTMIRKLSSGQYRLYSRKIDPKTGKRRNLGTFETLAKAKEHERAVQFFKRRG